MPKTIIPTNINNVTQIMELVSVLSGVDAVVELVAGNATINAKSVLGIMSLDLSNPVELVVYAVDKKTIKFIVTLLKNIEAI